MFRGRIWWVGTSAAGLLIYVVAYITDPSRPRAGGPFPHGWWDWFDQGQYLRGARAIASLNLSPSEYFYPPLYSLIAAPGLILSRQHPFFLSNLLYFGFFGFVLLYVAARFYGRVLPAAVWFGLLLFLPFLTLTQWVIPWTTSLQAALVSMLILIASAFEARAEPFRLRGRSDWIWFLVFFVFYGALFPTRPLDAVIWTPFAAWLFSRVTMATAAVEPRSSRPGVVFRCFVVAAAGALVFIALYAVFNVLVFGNPLGSYLQLAVSNRIIPEDSMEKLFSLFWRSSVVYGERGEAFFERVPILAGIFAICLVALVRLRDIRRIVLATAFLHLLLYVPYGELIPAGLFRYMNLHYFTWIYPWVAVIAAGELWSWLGLQRGGSLRWKPIAVTIALLLGGMAITIVPRNREVARDSRDVEPGKPVTLSLAASAKREVDYVDFDGVWSGPPGIYHPAALKIDGTPSVAHAWLVFTTYGARLVFQRPQMFRRLEVTFRSDIKALAGQGFSRLGSYDFGLACPIGDCGDPTETVWVDGVIDIDFRATSNAQVPDLSEWNEAEDWGRWSRRANSGFDLRIVPRPGLSIAANVLHYLVTPERPQQPASLTVNDCVIASTIFTAASGAAPVMLQGPIPPACVPPDGHLRIEVRTDALYRPKDLGINADDRWLGVGVVGITLRAGPQVSGTVTE